MNGYPTIKVMLPSRDEKCLFTLRPLTDTVGSFLTMVSEEDRGIENISVYKKGKSMTVVQISITPINHP